MNKVVVDTNFLIACIEAKRDYLREIELAMGRTLFIIPDPVIEELKKLKKEFALEILKLHNFKIVECEDSADNCVLKIAFKEEGFIASFDKKLKRRAREMGIKTITVRKGVYVMEDL